MKRFCLLLIVCTEFLSAAELSQLRWNYNITALESIAENQDASPEERAEALYFLYQVKMDMDYPQSEILESIEKAMESSVSLLDTREDLEPVLSVRISRMYTDKIWDAASWMKYSGKAEEWKSRARELEPENQELQILELNTLLYFPEGAGGDPEKGKSLLGSLLQEYPENPELLMLMVSQNLEETHYKDAENHLLELLLLYPEHRSGKSLLSDIRLSQAGLSIGDIHLTEDFNSRKEPIERITANYVGQPYTLETKMALSEHLMELPAVSGVSITAEEKLGEVFLTIDASEEEMSFYGLLLSLGIGGQNNAAPEFTGIPFPILLYGNQNLFGRGHRFSLVCAWIMYELDYIIPSQPGLPVDLHFNTSLMFLPSESTQYSDGKEVSWSQESNAYSLYMGIDKEVIGFTFSLGASGEYTYYQNPKGAMILSENPLKLSGILQLTNADSMAMPGSLPATGVSFNGSSEILYKPNYKEWGPSADPFQHNDNPAGKYLVQLGYQAEVITKHQIGAEISWFGGNNLYQSDLWAVGQAGMVGSGPSLPGYYPGEFLLETGMIGGISWFWSVGSDTVLYVDHRALVDQEDIKQGSKAGVSFTMPGDILVDLSGSIGWDAVRERGRGWQMTLNAARLFF